MCSGGILLFISRPKCTDKLNDTIRVCIVIDFAQVTVQSVISESSDSTRRIIRRVKMIVRQFAIAQHCHYHSCILCNLAQNAHFATLCVLLCNFFVISVAHALPFSRAFPGNLI